MPRFNGFSRNMATINLKIFLKNVVKIFFLKILRESSISILGREINPKEVYKKMKGCIFQFNLEGQG